MFDPKILKITDEYPMPNELMQAVEILTANGLPLVRVLNNPDYDWRDARFSKSAILSGEPTPEGPVSYGAGELISKRGLGLYQTYSKHAYTPPPQFLRWWRLRDQELPPILIKEEFRDLSDPTRIDWQLIHLLSSKFDFKSSQGHLGILWVLASIPEKRLRLQTFSLVNKVTGKAEGLVSRILNREGRLLLTLGSTTYPPDFEEDQLFEIFHWPPQPVVI